MTITTDDGVNVSWTGELVGPTTPLDETTGSHLTESYYTTEIRVEGEAKPREIRLCFTGLAWKEIQVSAPSNYKELVRRSVGRYLVNQIKDGWTPGNDECLSIPNEELISISSELRKPGAAN